VSREKEFQVGVKSVARDLRRKAFDVHRSEAADTRMALSAAQPTGPTEVRRFFNRHSRRWCSALLAAVHPFFHLLVELGAENEAIVGSSPVRWAAEQVEAVLSVELKFNAVELWMRWATTVDPPLPPAAIDDVVALKKYLTQWQAPEWLLFSFHPDLLGESRNVVRSGIKGTSQENLSDFIAELTQFFRTELRRGLDDIEKIERVECLRKPAVIIQAVQAGGAQAGNRSKGKGRPKDKFVELHQKQIKEVAAEVKFVGEAYCKALDDRNIQTPIRWQTSERCPKQYLQAYNHPDPTERKKWRQRINDEKYKASHVKPLAKTRN
jgi:hypothetical protein